MEREEGVAREGVVRGRRGEFTSQGITIGDDVLHSKADANGNLDLYLKRPDGSDVNLTGERLFSRATGDITLGTSAASIAGDGDSNYVRLLLPTIGEWLVIGTYDFQVTTGGDRTAIGQLYVDDSGSAETGEALHYAAGAVDRVTLSQVWPVTTTAVNTPVELKARRTTGTSGAIDLKTTSTTLAAILGAGGGSTVESVDHGTLTGRGDDDHTQYLLAAGTRDGSAGQAQDFGSNGIKTDVIAESTGAAGVTIDGVLIKDGEAIHPHASLSGVGEDDHHDETHPHDSHTGILGNHHDEAHTVASHSDTSTTGTQLNTVTDGSEVNAEHTHRLTTYITLGGDHDGIGYSIS